MVKILGNSPFSVNCSVIGLDTGIRVVNRLSDQPVLECSVTMPIATYLIERLK